MPEREPTEDSQEALRMLVQIMARRAARNYLKNLGSGPAFDKACFPDSTGET